jgi:hypothetical protein
MNNFVDPSGLRTGIPNSETDDQFKQRLRDYIFEYVCKKNKNKEVGTYEEVMERYNAAHPTKRLEQTIELEFDYGLITGDGTELRLTPKGIEKCKQLKP